MGENLICESKCLRVQKRDGFLFFFLHKIRMQWDAGIASFENFQVLFSVRFNSRSRDQEAERESLWICSWERGYIYIYFLSGQVFYLCMEKGLFLEQFKNAFSTRYPLIAASSPKWCSKYRKELEVALALGSEYLRLTSCMNFSRLNSVFCSQSQFALLNFSLPLYWNKVNLTVCSQLAFSWMQVSKRESKWIDPSSYNLCTFRRRSW